MRLLLAAALAAAQAPPPSPAPTPRPGPIVRVSVGIVQIDAVVTDGKGRHVTDLGPEDFVLKEGGKVREIAHVSYVAVAPAPRVVPPGAADPGPEAPVAAATPRLITLVVDDLNLSFESTVRLKETLRTFMEETLAPADRVALVRTGGGVGTMQQFTADRRQLAAAIDRIRFNPMGAARTTAGEALDTEMPFGGGPTGGSPSGRASHKETHHAQDRFREQLVAIGTMGTLRNVVHALASLPGRKAVVVFSDGLPAFDRAQEGRIEGQMATLVDEANRASASLYTIDARGLYNPALRAEDNVGQVDIRETTRILDRRVAEQREAREGLRNLADRTGGFMVTRSNDLSRALRAVVEDQQGYYLIGYVPPEGTPEVKSGRPRFHRLEVSVRRPGVRVRSRTGYYGVPDAEAPPPLSRPARMRAALLSPFAAADIPLRLQAVFLDDEKAGPSLRALLHLDGSAITFTDAEGGRQATLDVVAVTFGEAGEPVDRKDQTFTIKAPGGNPEAGDLDVVYTVDLPVERPGAYQFRVVVRDAVSDRLGAASQFVEVPDLRKGGLALSGIVVRSLAGDGGPAGAAAEALAGRVRTGDPMEYVFQILNARRDPTTRKTRLTTRVRLWKDRQLIYEGLETPLALEPADPARIAVAGTLNLSSRLPPGDYALEVEVVDRLAGRGTRVTRWADLEAVAR